MLGVEDVLDILCIPLLGIIPESKEVLNASNMGTPVTLSNPASAPARAYDDVARRLKGEPLELLPEPDRRRVLEVGPAGLDDPVRTRSPWRPEPSWSASSAGRSSSWIAIAPASCSAVGMLSFEDWPALTWSFGWTVRAAAAPRLASAAR